MLLVYKMYDNRMLDNCMIILCLVLLLGQNIFSFWTKLKLSKMKILSRVKKYIFCFQKSFKTKFPDWKSIFNNKYSFCMSFESKKCSFQLWTKILSWTISVLSRTKNILSE